MNENMKRPVTYLYIDLVLYYRYYLFEFQTHETLFKLNLSVSLFRLLHAITCFDIACTDLIQFLFLVADMAPTQSPTIAPTGPTATPSSKPSSTPTKSGELVVVQSTQVRRED